MIAKSNKGTSPIHDSDIWKFFIMYFFVYAIRFIVCAMLWPAFRLQNKHYNFKEYVGFAWGG